MTTNTPGSVRTLGTLRAAGGQGIVRLEDRFDTDMDDLWSALTDPRRLARWLGEVEAICARVVSSAHATLPADGKAPVAWNGASPHSGY